MQKAAYFTILCIFYSLWNPVHSQRGISFFINSELDRILAIAERENKDVFIDTYTKYCAPCKKLDKVFLDAEVGNFFNENFVNVKFDMETEAGKVLVSKYDVYFMPTLLILDKHGNIKWKWDNGLVDADQLLSMATRTVHPDLISNQAIASAPQVSEHQANQNAAPRRPESKSKTTAIPPGHERVVEKNPVTGSTVVVTKPIQEDTKEKKASEYVVKTQTKKDQKQSLENTTIPSEQKVFSSEDITTSSEEKILYVMDSGEGPPDFVLYEEAYFRLQLMDGSHTKAAKDYLTTQTDWLTEKNMRFLNDFLYTTKSEEFEFFVTNREAFENLLGNDQVQQTISILVNKQLERGFPRPDVAEAEKLYSLIGYDNPTYLASKHYLEGLYTQDSPENYMAFADEFCENLGSNDHFEMNRLAMLKATTSKDKKSIKSAISLAKKAIKLEPNKVEYLETLAYIHMKNNDKKKAQEAIESALFLSKTGTAEKDINEALMKQIQSM